MNVGKIYVLKGFHSYCNKLYRKKLLGMGFIPGTIFKVEHVAPLGDPVILNIKGSNLALRRAEIACLNTEETL
jgi:ferrous iron transport protein A